MPPNDILIRATAPVPAVEEDGRTLFGRVASANEWAEIDSVTEGHFLERHAPGAFRKTFAENRDKIRVLFQHGRDAEMGTRPIAEMPELGEDDVGPFYRAALLDGVPEMIRAGLRAGVYGSSHSFSVVREDWERAPKGGPHNPKRLPERTIREVKVFELGPVTWPAYAGSTASVRSLTDDFLPTPPVAPSLDAVAEEPHLEPERRDEPVPTIAAAPPKETVPVDITQYHTLDEMLARVHELNAEIKRAAELPGILPESEETARQDKVSERGQLEAAITAWRGRLADVRAAAEDPAKVEPAYTAPAIIKARDVASIYDVRRTAREARSEDQFKQTLRDNAMRAVEGASFANDHFPKQTGQGDIAELIDGRDQCDPVEVAKRVLYTGSPAYRRSYRKRLLGDLSLTAEEASAADEARAALVTASNVAVPYDLDTTMQINTAGAVNPYREAFRVVKTTSNDWRPMVSSGMTAVYVGEATAPSEGAPAFTAPARLLVKAHTVAKFSTEIQGDYPGLENELAREISDAKDVLESVQFTTGAGTTVYPQGIFTAFTANFLDTATTLVIVPSDLYKLEANLGPRYRANAVWLGSPYFYSLIRGIDTAGGAGIWVDNLREGGAVGNATNNGRLGNLLGHPAYEVGGLPDGTMATTEKVAILADPERFVIIDRIGMNLELIPNFLDATTGYPTGERMVYAWWRNTSVGIGLATLGAGRAACIFRGK